MLIVQYKILSALRADENGVCMCMQSKLTYQAYNMIFSLRFARITVHIIANFVWGDLDEMIDFKRKKMAWHGSIFDLNEH